MRKRIKILSTIVLLIVLGLYLINQGVRPGSPNPDDTLGLRSFAPSFRPTFQPVFEASSSVEFDSTGLVTATVTKVIDGDTIQVNSNGQISTVRYIGINTPETVDPRRGVQCFGHESSDENKKLVEGKIVILVKDISETDKYNRLLRYIYLPLEGNKLLFVNDYLVREGFAEASTYPPDVKYSDQLAQASKQAQSQNKGLWAKCR